MISNYEKQVDIGKEWFLKYEQEPLAEKFHLNMDETWIYLTYLGTPYRIERATGTVYELNRERNIIKNANEAGEQEEKKETYQECRSYETVMTIYDMLFHGREKELPPLSGKWTPIANFAAAGASPGTGTFTQKYANSFSGKTEELKAACVELGGEIKPRLAGADVTAEIPAFAFFTVLLQFWDGDEEFAPKVKLLWDDQTMRYLHFETTYYLQGDLLERLKTIIEHETRSRAK